MKVFEIIEDAYSHNKTHEVYWDRLKPEEQAEWKTRKVQLENRARKIYSRLVGLMPQEDRVSIKGVPLNVPLHGEMAWAAADYVSREIVVDLGCFWDLPDDCLGYTIGHEIGHFVYEKKNPGFWRKRIPPALNRQLEMDADVYGAILAYRLGYDPRKAWSNFTRAEREAPANPKYPSYPSVQQRQSNVAAAIKKDKDERAARSQTPAVKDAPVQQPPTSDVDQVSTTKPEEMIDAPLSPAAKIDLSHSIHGIEGLLAILNKDPQIAMQMFPGAGGNDTAYA